ncbi:MAG TPA: kelch repeat-containing protein [Candidatus Saccharimonadales bacterium]|nr:kelch repeat-containing protein [Candidatus Saccharimonadales bacterium]
MSSEIRLSISLLVIIIFAAVLSLPMDVKGIGNSTWELRKEMPTNRTEIVSEKIGDKIYVMGGADYLKDGIMNVVEIYNPINDTWSESTPLPISIDHTAMVSYDDKLFLIGGFLEDKNPTDRLLIYDTENDTWSEGAPLTFPRGALAAEVINSTIYAVGGVNSTHDPVATNEAYNIVNNTWSVREPMSKPKHHIASAVVDNAIYILGGRLLGNGEPSEINESLTNMDDNSRYDPKSDTWVELEPMQIRRSGFTASEVNDQIFVFGGQTPEGATDKVERYDPKTNLWYSLPDMEFNRSGATSIDHGNQIYVFGGQREGLHALNVNEVLRINSDNYGTTQ